MGTLIPAMTRVVQMDPEDADLDRVHARLGERAHPAGGGDVAGDEIHGGKTFGVAGPRCR